MVTIRKIEKTTVYLLFSLFIQFSAIEIRLVFSQAKFMISRLQWLEKKLGCMLVGELWPFFNWQSSISRQVHHVFNMRVHKGALNDAINYVQKGCAVQMWGLTLSELIILLLLAGRDGLNGRDGVKVSHGKNVRYKVPARNSPKQVTNSRRRLVHTQMCFSPYLTLLPSFNHVQYNTNWKKNFTIRAVKQIVKHSFCSGYERENVSHYRSTRKYVGSRRFVDQYGFHVSVGVTTVCLSVRLNGS